MVKVLLISIILFLATNTGQAQDLKRKYYTQENKETKDSTRAFYYQEIQNFSSIIEPVTVIQKYCSTNKTKLFGSYNNVIERKFIGQKLQAYENGKIKAKEKFSEDGVLIDTAQYYHPNGKVKISFQYLYNIEKEITKVTDTLILIFKDSLGNTHLVNGKGYAEINSHDNDSKIMNPLTIEKGHFVNHKRIGEWTGYFSDGDYTFIEHYNQGKLISGITKDKSNNQTKYDQSNFYIEPNYPSGMNEFRRYIGNNYRYPKEAINAGVIGEVVVSFVVEKNGKISSIEILKDLGYRTGEEAANVVNHSKKWKPGIIRGIPVRVAYKLPIRLNLARR